MISEQWGRTPNPLVNLRVSECAFGEGRTKLGAPAHIHSTQRARTLVLAHGGGHTHTQTHTKQINKQSNKQINTKRKKETNKQTQKETNK